MRPNPDQTKASTQGRPNRVTSMARWLSRKRGSAAATAPKVSVVIPVYNAETTLTECLTRLYESRFQDFEAIVVDDGSTDQSSTIAGTFPVRIVPTAGRVGPAAARNLGARMATGEVLFFIDSDVMVRPETLPLLAESFEAGDVDGLCGVQAAQMRYTNLASQYKNLWMRWTYLRQTGDVPLFYTTAAAIRREAFLRVGGFDQGYATPNVEDTAFGQKLARLGVRVRVHPDLEVEHVKQYNLWSMLRTDFMRSVSLTRLKLRHPSDLAQNNTSVPSSYVASVPLACLTLLIALVGLAFRLPGTAALAGAGVAGVMGLNWEFLTAIRRADGWLRMLAAVPVLWAELLVAGAGTAAGMASYPFGRRY
ncbi:MAG TPA: glycosyltransferase family 2 protein [Candidatus Eisenbacteria bacterium]|nr:glycosyltransferase family 2 protein [Candidatus Eisenbacteria bacterium]